MSEFVRPHYRNAPIAEALIDIRVPNPDAVTLEQLTEAADQLGVSFSSRQPINMVELGFDFAASRASNSQVQAGWRLDGTNRVLQLQRIGFTFSHMPPYSDWETFRTEARRHWEVFQKSVKQSSASRVAVRVINKILVPHSEISLDEYLSIYPVVPPRVPATAVSAFMRLQLDVPNVVPNAKVILNVASGRNDAAGPHLVLDIDLFATGEFSEGELWSHLERFGTEKDVIFESCITDKVREAIK